MVKDYLQEKVEYFVADGFYAKKKVVDKITGLGFSFISKLPSDADMKYFYQGEHEKRKGAKKKYQGKVIWKECFERFSFVTTLENGIKLYSKHGYSVCLKRQLRVVVLQTYNSKGKMGYALLFSTDTTQDPIEIYHYYSLRFSIEFLFRDAKSHLGLQHCQARQEDKLCFHFNFVFLVLNLAKWEILQSGKSSISIADLKSEYFNRSYLETIFTKLDLQTDLLKNHPNYPLLENWGQNCSLILFTLLLLYTFAKSSDSFFMPDSINISYRNLNLLLFALLISVILFHLAFPEFVQEENGLGWDGDAYATMIKDFKPFIAQRQLNSYYFQRIFPVAVVYAILKILQITVTNSHIIAAFLVLNVMLLLTAFVFWVKICQVLKLSVASRALSFTGVFVNYAILKMPFYYPVLTDLIAFTIGIMMLYCFLKNYIAGLIIISIVGAFSFPTLFYCGMLLYIFPINSAPVPQAIEKPVWNKWLALLAMVGFIFVWLFARIVKDKPYINPVEEAVLPVSLAFALGYIFLIITQIAQPKKYIQEALKSPTWRRAVMAGVLFLAIKLFTQLFASPEAPVLNYKGFAANVVLEAITNPLVFIVAHFMYFGPLLFLLLYYWKPFIGEVNKYGAGLHLFVLIYLLIGIGSESRQFINAWPVFVLLLCAALEKYRFPHLFYILMGVIALIISRFWYRINQAPFTGDFLDFPYQHYFMLQGPWMSDAMYYLQGSITLVICLLLYLLFFRKSVRRHA